MADSSTLIDRVKIFIESSGTGPFQLGNALPSFRGSEALVDGLTYSYAVESGSDYEVGQGVYVLAVDQLIRAPTLSSNGGAPVSFPANVAINFTALAADLVAGLAGSGTVTSVQASGGTTGLTLTGGPITGAGTLTLGGTLGLANGGTSGTDGPTARTALGLGNVDNTSDANKPISTATQTALDAKVPSTALGETSVFDGFIPVSEQAAILDGSSTYDCTADIHDARDAVDGTGKTLVFPFGKYYVGQLVFSGSNYVLDTSGSAFQQKPGLTTNGDGVLHPIISFTENSENIRMGDVRLFGNIATDFNEYSHGIIVGSAKNITIGNIYGQDIRGDVLYTYGRTTSEPEYQRNLVTGVIRGANIFRCIVAMAGGDATIAGIYKDGAVGYRDFDAEPNTGGAYQPVSARIGFIRGAVVQCTSDDTGSINQLVSVEEMDLDGDRLANSTPAYSSYPGTGAIALSINRTDTVRIGFLKLRNYESYPVRMDDLWKSIEIGTLDFANCGTTETTYKSIILQGGTAGDGVLSVGRIVGTLAANTRMILRSDTGNLKVNVGSIDVTGGLLATLISGQIGSVVMDCGGGSGDFFLSQAEDLQIGKGVVTNSANIYGLVACNNVVFSNFSGNFGLGFDYTSASTNIVALNSTFQGVACPGVNVLAGGSYYVNGTKVVGDRVTGAPAVATDPATTMALANWLRTVVVTHGLGS